MTREAVFALLSAERDRQDRKFPDQIRETPPPIMLAVLVEEIGEVAQALLQHLPVREELIHVAAVAVWWLENLP